MGKKLLLPTDFSKHSWNAIQYTRKLYENENCNFYILNAYSEESHGLDSLKRLDPDDAFNNIVANRSQKELGEIMMRLMSENENSLHKFHVLSRSELFLDAVKTIVDELQIDLIIMGAKGMTKEREGKYGKNALAVIENIRKCPVLLVPAETMFDHPKEIVLATNFNSEYNISGLKHLAEIAKISNARIQVLSLEDNDSLTAKQKENKMLLRKYIKDVDHSYNVLHNVKMADALSCFVEIRHSNMISYIDKKPSFWEKLGFGKPTLCKLGYYKNVPVLALHG
ncbi:universal stress protein [Muriicola sp. SD30]|uniref:universal stress protein n=1 Tax=Muriicola sp. SD30 TaxID=3240936 RepID=UPI0035108660